MHVPCRSLISKVFSHDTDEAECIEDLRWWEFSDGKHLAPLRVLTQARRFGPDVYALLTLAGDELPESPVCKNNCSAVDEKPEVAASFLKRMVGASGPEVSG